MAHTVGVREDVDYEALMEKHGGSMAAASREVGMPASTFTRHVKKLGLYKTSSTMAVLDAAGDEETCIPRGGMDLSKVQTRDKKPADSVRRKLYTLPQGQGFPLDSVAEEWGVSPETLRRHAKRVGAWQWADPTGNENWIEIVMYPRGG